MGEAGRQIDAVDFEGAFALLAEMTRDFAASLDIATALERALASIAAHVGAEAGSLWLVESDGQELVCRACVGANPITGMRLGVSEGIVGKSVRENECQRVLDVEQDPNFSGKADAESGFVTRSILCAPMRFSQDVLGAVEIINKSTGDQRFAESDADLLQVLASSAGLGIANARLADAKVENERVGRELELAAEIQRSLLPAPRGDGFPVYGLNIPARTVSGDFFDILPLSDDQIAFCLGDVSGKGMNAAILMSKTASLYRCLVRDTADPGPLLERLNDEICETATRGMFVTMAAGVYDRRNGSVCMANAGHEPALLRTGPGRLDSISADAPPLGIVAGSPFPTVDLDLAGGSLYLFSDGLTEAVLPSGEQLGRAGFADLLERFADKPLPERIETISNEAGRLHLRDDLTLLGVSDEGRRP